MQYINLFKLNNFLYFHKNKTTLFWRLLKEYVYLSIVNEISWLIYIKLFINKKGVDIYYKFYKKKLWLIGWTMKRKLYFLFVFLEKKLNLSNTFSYLYYSMICLSEIIRVLSLLFSSILYLEFFVFILSWLINLFLI